MPTPAERLQRIVDAFAPSEVVFKPAKSTDRLLVFVSVVTKKKEVREVSDDIELQKALRDNINETWSADDGKYFINSTVDTLWNKIKSDILREYENVSGRCDATKRKTLQFIRNIEHDEKHLPNYLIQVFLKINSPSYDLMSRAESEALFEQFESLRRTYGKRSR
jgi:hypothetical protein